MSWRAIEWWGAGVSIFLQTGAIFQLFMSGPDGDLSDAAKSKLRLVSLPVYAFAILILSQHRRQFLLALARNIQFQLLILMPLVSVLWSVSPSTTLRRAIGLLFSMLLAYVLAIRFTPRQLLLLLMAVLGTCIVLSLVLLVVSPHMARMPLDNVVRGVFLHKNSLGWYASILALVTTIVIIDGSLGFRRTAMALLAPSLICLAISSSMTSAIATVSACCLIWIYSTLPRMRGISRVAFVLLVFQITVTLLITLHEFLVPFLEAIGKDATLTGRVPLWELVDAEISRHLLLGFGYQAFWTEGNSDAWVIWSTINWMAPHSHNGYRDVLLSFGVGGAVLFVFVLCRAVYQGATLQCRAPQGGWLWLNVFMIMMLVMNLTESIFLLQNDSIFILFATAIIMFSYYQPTVESRPALKGAPAEIPDPVLPSIGAASARDLTR